MNLKTFLTKTVKTNENWSLFLDRDGVINRRIIDDYVKKPEEFKFNEGVVDSMSTFAKYFKHIFVVTNQQGIGKGKMSHQDLHAVNNFMQKQIEDKGGKIDAIYYCPDLANTESKNRKPEIGMALQAKKEFPEVDFSESIMVGDSPSDIEFGKRLGMTTIFVDNNDKVNNTNSDFVINSLTELCNSF